MKTEKYTSLKLSEEIAEVAKEKGIELPESEYSWLIGIELGDYNGEGVEGWYGKDEKHIEKTLKIKDACEFPEDWEEEGVLNYPAYDTYELGEILNKSKLEYWHSGDYISGGFICSIAINPIEGRTEHATTEVEARGEMLLYLLKNDLLK